MNRRALLGGLAGLAAAGAAPDAARADDDSPIATGVLKDNALAKAFTASPVDSLPNVRLDTPNGPFDIADILQGRTVLMPVFAEWCVPCLIEIPDFARLQEVYGNEHFAILPVLSWPRKQMTPLAVAGLFQSLRAEIFTPMAEQRFGGELVKHVARRANSLVLPCNLLIDPKGRIVAREIGLETNGVTPAKQTGDYYERADQAAHGQTQSLWGTAAGDAFATALANGFLK
ncbi:MAG TPA: TlpA disulfide reductase family protein [Rhizomicrobium sp.]|jgi:thiol-disulfide isomerase/thioredoxin|nr:TlpA disulfide reductase family protein [Rhizomicrobium sp.]